MVCRVAPLVVVVFGAAACHAASPHPIAAPATGAACTGSLLAAPADLAAPGPWPVGARTVDVDGVTVEVWYPARPGSERGAPAARYDLRTAMPPAEAAKIPDADNAWLPCACARDLPVDDAHGPYPVVVFFHGAASFRAQSAFLATHWASRGFVVIAPDLPGVGLAAVLGGGGRLPLGVPAAMLDLVAQPPAPDPLAFVRARLGTRIAVAGHSLGNVLAGAILDRPQIDVAIAMAGATGDEPIAGSTLVLGGDHDRIAPTAGARGARRSATHPARDPPRRRPPRLHRPLHARR